MVFWGLTKVGVMDLYLRGDSNNLIIPNDKKTAVVQHACDRSPSPNEWSQWEVGRIENFAAPDEFVNRSVKPIGSGLNINWQILNENFESESSICDGEFSSNQSVYGHFSLGDSCATNLGASSFHKHESLDDFPDSQLQSSMEQMDDFWESMFTDDSPSEKNLSNSFDPAYGSMSFGNLLADMLMDPYDSLKDPSFMGSRSCLKRKFTLTDDVAEEKNQVEDASPSSLADNSMSPEGSPTVKASVLSVLVPAELTTSSEIVSNVQEKKCLEATVLWELEDVTSQLNMEMRICFRDALYRLAKISKQHHSFVKEKPSSRVDDKSSCPSSSKSAEAETNAIDRTVANLMFNRPNSGPSPGPPCLRSVYQRVGSCQNSCSYGDILDEPATHSCHHHLVSLPCDFEASASKNENSSCGHLAYGLSCLDPTGATDYISDMSNCRVEVEESVAIVDQFGRN